MLSFAAGGWRERVSTCREAKTMPETGRSRRCWASRHTTNIVTPVDRESATWKPEQLSCGLDLPVLFADNSGRASPLRLDVLGTPRLDEVVVVLAAQLFLSSPRMSAKPSNPVGPRAATYVDVIAHCGGFVDLQMRYRFPHVG